VLLIASCRSRCVQPSRHDAFLCSGNPGWSQPFGVFNLTADSPRGLLGGRFGKSSVAMRADR